MSTEVSFGPSFAREARSPTIITDLVIIALLALLNVQFYIICREPTAGSEAPAQVSVEQSAPEPAPTTPAVARVIAQDEHITTLIHRADPTWEQGQDWSHLVFETDADGHVVGVSNPNA